MRHKDFEMVTYLQHDGEVLDASVALNAPHDNLGASSLIFATITTSEAILADEETLGYAACVAIKHPSEFGLDSNCQRIISPWTILHDGLFECECVGTEEAAINHKAMVLIVQYHLRKRIPLLFEEMEPLTDEQAGK